MAMSGENIPLAAAVVVVLCSDEVLRLPAVSGSGGCCDGCSEAGLGLMIRPRVSRPEDGLDVEGRFLQLYITIYVI